MTSDPKDNKKANSDFVSMEEILASIRRIIGGDLPDSYSGQQDGDLSGKSEKQEIRKPAKRNARPSKTLNRNQKTRASSLSDAAKPRSNRRIKASEKTAPKNENSSADQTANALHNVYENDKALTPVATVFASAVEELYGPPPKNENDITTDSGYRDIETIIQKWFEKHLPELILNLSAYRASPK